MVNHLTGKYRKHIAALLFLLFYGELAGTLYAGAQYHREIDSRIDIYIPVPPPPVADNNRQISFPVGKAAQAHETPEIKTSEPVAPEPAAIDSSEASENSDKVDIGGPAQPEMSTFRSAGADNMVNLFTGDFSYSLPVLDVGGYPVNLFYSAGITMDQEASWVGLGWNINPGTISRNMRGLPDDYEGTSDVVKKVQSMKPDITIGVTGSTGHEIAGLPIQASSSVNAGIFYNNRRGLGLEVGASGEMSIHTMLSKKNQDEKTTKDTIGDIKTSVSGGINLNSQQGMTLNAGFQITKYNYEKQSRWGLGTAIGYSSRQGLTDLKISGESSWYDKQRNKLNNSMDLLPERPTVNISFARSSFTPSIRMPVTSLNQYYSVKMGKEQKVWFKNYALSGYVTESRIQNDDTVQIKPAYGYMYYERAASDNAALIDFNRVNDGVYTYKTPAISLPVYTYDVFTINGEGTGGSFRGYRGNMGYVRDNYTKNKSGSFTLSIELGGGGIFHGGTMLGGVYSPSVVEEWKQGNGLRQTAAFKETDGLKQSFYFKNPGEKAIIDEDYYKKMGEDQLIRPYLRNTRTATPNLASGFQVFDKDLKVEKTIPVDASSIRAIRDKRTQVITFLTAEDAEQVGLDKLIASYTENVFKPGSCADPLIKTTIRRFNPLDPGFYRKAHHISQVNVLESDGRRYVFGIPVYQIKQQEVTFSTENTGSNQLVSYSPNTAHAENSTRNNKGRDGFYQREETNGYAHSYLLTGILSPDYVDVTGDGISDDDLGTAVKFNYSRVNRQQSLLRRNYWQPFRWRMPVDENKANYNEGLKGDSKDDKGLYTYGEKELWYLHSLESKNMVATFHISSRDDGAGVKGENGGASVSGQRQKKLDSINLYTKADYLKHGGAARPIKTVHFRYSYKLCKNYLLNNGGSADKGKLTLDSLWFSYNGNQRQKKNKYVFKYAGDDATLNPNYNSSESDRWGNYKPHAANPASGISNNDFPYTLQGADNTNNNNAYASSWNLVKILLPSGGTMQVDYEADDYAYVQDKRASQMTKIAGFGMTAGSTPDNRLYDYNIITNPAHAASPGLADHRFVFFDVTEPIADNREIAERYLKDFRQLLLRLWVKMPRGNIGMSPMFEPVNVYGMIKSYGLAPASGGGFNPNRFYVELEETRKGGSPIMETVMQFLKDHLPQRAYPGSDVKGDGLGQVVNAVWGLVNSFVQGVMGFEKNLKFAGGCKVADLEMCFARLNNRDFKKAGGGHRVKRIIIGDNWTKMTKRGDLTGLPASYYGQEYDYSTTEEVNGEQLTISSGVASYEPGVGNEENPFREVLKYAERQFLGPTDHNNVEMPLAETFFPSAMVGYSKVAVRSIHNKNNKKIKSGIGLQQTEFYTTRDFPVISDFTSFDNDSRHQHRPPLVNKIFNFNKKDYLTLSQGFRVVLNDMNGKIKSQTSYAENDLKTPISFTSYHYRLKPRGGNKFRLDNVVPVISGPDGKITNKLIGKEVEVMNDFREHFSHTYSANIPLNAEFFTVGGFPVLIPSIFRMAFRDESKFRSATTLKVVNEYGILDSVVNIDKGSVVSTKNLVYDAESGEVLVSRTNNEFRKPVYQFNYPAWWVHTGMQPAYRNIDLTYKNVLFRNGKIEASPHVDMNLFESGDEIFVVEQAGTALTESAACITGGYPTAIQPSTEVLIWAVDLRKDTRNSTRDFIFLERDGKPFNAVDATIRIIRSGKRNLTGASVGNIVSMANPIRTVALEERVVIDNNTDVVNAGAAEFKEKWRANDMFYSQDTTIVTVRQALLMSETMRADTSYSAERIRDADWDIRGYNPMSGGPFEIMKKRRMSGSSRRWHDQNSWVRFNIPSVLAGKIVKSATIDLIGHKRTHSSIQIGHHPAGQPHQSHENNDHPSPMTIKLSRMLTPWYSGSDDNSWKQIFDDRQSDDVNNNNKTFTPPYVPSQATFTGSYKVDITAIANGMVQNMGNPSVAPGIKLSFLQASNNIDDHDDNSPWRYCFNVKQPETDHYESPIYGININLKYYKCDLSNPVVYEGGISGAPLTPPTGYEFCKTYVTGKMCFSVFDKKQMNPYIQGVLGNWRAFRSYVYYGERRETDPTVLTDIPRDGIIKAFEPYWAFADEQLGKTNSLKWVWNSEITQHNRKGAELENHDPLDRYNSGIYGYQESLPVAVINNSRLRLSAFDGFEDYYYKDDPCEPFCKPSKRHFNAGVTTSMLDTTESHTGKYSVKIDAAATHNINVKISPDDPVAEPDIRIKVAKTPYENFVRVTPKGIGLKGYYYNHSNFGGSPAVTRIDPYVNLTFEGSGSAGTNNCPPFFFGSSFQGNLPNGVYCNNMSIKWKGKLQVITGGYYQFDTDSDDEMKVYIVDNSSTNVQVLYDDFNGPATRQSIYLNAGTLYTFEVQYKQHTYTGKINLLWRKPNADGSVATSGAFVPVPPMHFYPEGQESLAAGTTETVTVYCEKPDTIQAINHHLIDSFNLIPGKQMLASVWIKKGGQDCKCTGYDVNMYVKNAGGTVIGTFTAKEKIIEGWQLFETIFTVPETGNNVKIELNSPSDQALFVDDLRLHPFNANMKSFVYHPETLRLSAELDENNYASFYEYDDEGTLIRVKKETRLGIKTIKETRSAVQKSISEL